MVDEYGMIYTGQQFLDLLVGWGEVLREGGEHTVCPNHRRELIGHVFG